MLPKRKIFYYTTILWATLFGWLFWDDLPTIWIITGATIIIISNLVIAWREQRIKTVSPPP